MKFVFDLDGTICFKGQPISSRFLQLFERLAEGGIETIFASARPIRDMLPVIDEAFHHYTLIGGNGSLIYKDGNILQCTPFPTQVLSEIKKLIHRYQATYLIDGEWDYAYIGPDKHPILHNLDAGKLAKKVRLDDLDRIVKVLLLTSNNMEALADDLLKLDVHINTHRNENVLDISPRGIHKWSALKALGINEGTYIAFGNDANDKTMFEHALHTVMIGHNEQLAPYAKESISLNGDYEREIAEKILSLWTEYGEPMPTTF